MERTKQVYSQIMESITGDQYQTTSKVNVWLRQENVPEDVRNNVDWESTLEAYVRFDIDIEARSWGIKDITVTVQSISDLEVIIVDAETMDEHNPVKVIDVNIDPTKLKTEKNDAEKYGVTVGDIDLEIDYDGNINYETSYIQVHSI